MISYQTESGSPVVEIHVSGSVTNTDLKARMAELRRDFDGGGKHRILEIIDHFTGIEPAALWTDARLGIPLANRVDRVAVVADQAWIRAFTHLGGLFTRAEIKSFEPAQIAEARSWINQSD